MQQALAHTLRRDSCCIDIGAFVGTVLSECVRLAPEGRHYAFEPIPQRAARLKAQFPGVEVHQVALSDVKGTAPFHHVVTNPGYSGLQRRKFRRPNERVELITVETALLDDIIRPDARVDFMKVDVEGAELQVFRGAKRTIQRCQPFIVFEHGPAASGAYGTTSPMVFRFLTDDCGMRIFGIDGSGPLQESEFGQPGMWNFVAHP